MRLFKRLGLLLVFTAIFSCNDDTDSDYEGFQKGILKNLSGFDGCGWIIQLTDSTKLDPINLSDFDIKLIENKSVRIQYHERTDLGSYCMVGKVVELDSID